MGLWKKLTGELVDVIDWVDDSHNTMVYRFERQGNEIKYGAMLTVRESQVAVFVNEGQIADVFPPGLYQLETNNLPILTTLQSWPSGFKSPFKAEVYFISTKQFTDLKWGTKNPIMLRDEEFTAVRLRAFGTYSIRISDAVTFLKEIAGTDGFFTTEEITNQLRDLIVTRFSTALAQSSIPILDLAANYGDLSDYITPIISPEFKAYGLGLTKLLVENISLPEEVEAALDKKTSMGIIGDLSKYVQFEGAQSMSIAAANPGSDAASGIGLGLGIAMAERLGKSLSNDHSTSAQQANHHLRQNQPPPLPTSEKSFYVALNGEQTGPFSLAEVKQKIDNGTVKTATLIWSAGMSNWQKAGETPSIRGLFNETPPPIPSS